VRVGGVDGPWSTAAPLSVARQEVAVAAVGGRVYVVGGLLAGQTTSDLVEAWDPGLELWETVAPLPLPLHHTTATGVGGKLYVIGGWSDLFATPQAVVLVYDPVTDAWSSGTPMPTARGSPAAAALDGDVHVVGGWNMGSVTAHEVYDPATDTWSTATPLPVPRNHHGAAVVNGTLYAVGGRVGLGFGVDNRATVHAFEAGAWSSRAPMLEARSGMAVTALGGRVYVFGGEGDDTHPSGCFPDVDAYDPILDAWTARTPMPTPRHLLGAAPLGDCIHVPGGSPVFGFGVTDVHEVYRPASDAAAVPALPAGALLVAVLALGLLGALGLRRGASSR
jgi:N-acetylneuraminic acid mutarotase